ncbi:DgyrCDS8867 [Dimorphilus gyrociliatus]|uniref:DgyrCDS8867 n=1 Tax=Dimorphilus gyrociliatus TaxID=2664684 RepID=A0A7I8VVN0_9ANNE|nr:DgyrCDS8867 [Dimorphilus gyrociliatus]
MTCMRKVIDEIYGKETKEGVGAAVRRSIGGGKYSEFDPFLLLDDFTVSPPAGFPDHPHRGFETVTYMLSGRFRHQDFLGNSGVIGTGDIQWMTAGRGVVHCEMPDGENGGRGLQLWVNLSRNQKLCDSEYQDISHKDLPIAEKDGVQVRIIAGESMNVKSKIITKTPTVYLDFTLKPGSKFEQATFKGWSTFAYILDGIISFGGDGEEKDVSRHNTAIFSDGDSVRFINKGSETARFVFISGKPIGEPVCRRGPFVMTTQEEIEQALSDFKNGVNGFENAREWKSKV